MLIDSHCHINDLVFLGKEDRYVKEAKENGVEIMLVVGYDVASSLRAVEIAEQFEGVFAAVGIIPAEVKNVEDGDLAKIEALLTNKKVIAIGEIGLDYYWDKEEKLKYSQREYFIKQIELANKYNLPVSIHCRDGYENCLEILKEHPVNKKGIIHCFSSSPEMAKNFVKLGYLIGIGGTCTFKNAVKTKAVAKLVDNEHFVLETDAPYLTPEPFRGKENQSKYLSYIRDEIAFQKGIHSFEVEELSTNNFKRLFNL